MRDVLLGLIAALLVALNVQIWILTSRHGQEVPIAASCTVSKSPGGDVTDGDGTWLVHC